ncbi:BQ2448_2821 [Microbotryum intermedium]|uniref:BQ2448_2821 protein n=1 Tax=Microbotryum intermedium TaxID=269621 RepID=A0A238FGV5_9BASI|nr:BQ2448_2821 [Microbotryum intermedium]
MSNSWAFSQLNQLTPSPGVSPQNGPDAIAQRDDLSCRFCCPPSWNHPEPVVGQAGRPSCAKVASQRAPGFAVFLWAGQRDPAATAQGTPPARACGPVRLWAAAASRSGAAIGFVNPMPPAQRMSFPCDGTVLQAQLEAWTSVAFDFDSAADDSSPTNSSSLFTDASKGLDEDHAARDRYRLNLASAPGSYAFDSGLVEPPSDRDLDALLSTGLGPSVAALDPYASLVDPTLHLPTGGNAIASTSSASAIVDAFAMLPNSLVASPSASKAAEPVVTSVTTSSTSKPKKAAAPRGPKKAAATTAMVETPVAQDVEIGVSTPQLELIDGDDEANRVAVEEDKRRRNTAASARFRIKKKQREQALESTAKELRDRVAALEAEVAGLRTENGWLRGLITDKPKNPLEDADLKLLLSGSRKRGREDEQEGHAEGADKSVVANEA